MTRAHPATPGFSSNIISNDGSDAIALQKLRRANRMRSAESAARMDLTLVAPSPPRLAQLTIEVSLRDVAEP